MPTTASLRATCMDGSTIVVAVHGFAKGAEGVAVAEIGEVIARALGGRVLPLAVDYPATAHIKWTGSQILRDTDEASAWHAVVNLEVTVAS